MSILNADDGSQNLHPIPPCGWGLGGHTHASGPPPPEVCSSPPWSTRGCTCRRLARYASSSSRWYSKSARTRRSREPELRNVSDLSKQGKRTNILRFAHPLQTPAAGHYNRLEKMRKRRMRKKKNKKRINRTKKGAHNEKQKQQKQKTKKEKQRKK